MGFSDAPTKSKEDRIKKFVYKGSCPCLSGEPYKACCKIYHDNPQSELSAEALARARYSALAMQKYEFIMETTHSSHPDYTTNDRGAWKQTITNNMKAIRFCGFNITESESLGEDQHAVSIVAAAAPLDSKVGKATSLISLAERSIYQREHGKWYYASATDLKQEVVENAITRL
eukprot:CAMPEP_0172682160 /NCGR_PEP_ID=MMETSP1074-20121228/17967_1 /TAXON_ID=2916 /ORGANISM="Ceratium fusus, Strain PA161109" /LENGTH=173 /DNA_ID=CAMNT_0013500795 /DNA_START=203 /DNA_END=727 /DNA_ORIENTATION=+